jgi:hypothetical protein
LQQPLLHLGNHAGLLPDEAVTLSQLLPGLLQPGTVCTLPLLRPLPRRVSLPSQLFYLLRQRTLPSCSNCPAAVQLACLVLQLRTCKRELLLQLFDLVSSLRSLRTRLLPSLRVS